ncbi:MAG: hypothetical protein G01um101418_529 [Parcubacteria group bacterium Gr01-1014_18]|nr:MAG: hypothetical protein Greene041636_575 [Parcubacteria group bacterium Greene0416_36]TSC80992.1 MAG: hypothetical protein G01um101418_529 [Parcubacteria group bacterium Gr01-1014_18]TSC98879.1 MAG: hypothetical protein Greene101420_512 [Parcubacteria group bacterium Greene1014_20]
MTKKNLAFIGLGVVVVATLLYILFWQSGVEEVSVGDNSSGFKTEIEYKPSEIEPNPEIAKDFDTKDIYNLADMQKAYGVNFSPKDLAMLAQNKFVTKNILETSIRPDSTSDNAREFLQLYKRVQGPTWENGYKERGPENSIFFSSDVFFNAYNNLYTELLKEMENKIFYPNIKALSQKFYEAAAQKLKSATIEEEKNKWMRVRNYFAVAHTLFSTAKEPLKEEDFQDSEGHGINPNDVIDSSNAKDKTIDTYENASLFVKKLALDAESEKAVLGDLEIIFGAEKTGVPAVFKTEYETYAEKTGMIFKVDFTQFTPRGTYTSSSLRRQYFRGMKWFISVPFFIKSSELTDHSFGIAELMAENPEALKNYNELESAINFLVGSSDDLMPVDYLQALAESKGSADPSAAAMQYLVKAHDPKIKDLAAEYRDVGTENSDDVRLATKGMRFFSPKFVIDSYWTGFLTQGDEAPRPGYTQKLPPMASSLEVMALLGSDYARTQISKLDFYAPSTREAIEKAMGELAAQKAELTDADWQNNIYNGWLWTIQSLFGWQKQYHDVLPQFMQNLAWEAKTLETASGWWTELRHAAILYAKQSFAEKGGGGPAACDPREVPPAPKSYIEPQLEAYTRLHVLAKRTYEGLHNQGYELLNLDRLDSFIHLMDTVVEYTEKELTNAILVENIKVIEAPDRADERTICVEHVIEGGSSDWEKLRLEIISGLQASLPVPLEGSVLPAKDRRAALVADVHTGGDSNYDTRILYEGTGIPYVIFTAVNDANGKRLTIGFTYSHYEFTELLGGQRLTDEKWQSRFYEGDESYEAYHYTHPATWPKTNFWYAPLFNLK